MLCVLVGPETHADLAHVRVKAGTQKGGGGGVQHCKIKRKP